MKNIWIMTVFTLREALARKVFIFFLIISALVIVGTAVIFSIVDTDVLLSNVNTTGENAMLGEMIGMLEMMIVSPLAGLCLLLAIFASASFVPIMLEKGNIDLLLSKPVSRMQLLTGKYLGGIVVVFINIAFLIIGIWFLISITFSYWDFTFLWVILTVSFTFAVLYSVIVLFGVITQGSMLGMMIAYLIYLILSPLLLLGKDKLDVLIRSEFVKGIIEALYYFFPKTAELMGEVSRDLAIGKGITDFQPVITSFLFLILIFGYAVYLFRKKDF